MPRRFEHVKIAQPQGLFLCGIGWRYHANHNPVFVKRITESDISFA
jgi:hypothetical protein